MTREKLLKVPEVAKILSLTQHTIRNYLKKKIIKGSKIGNRYFIPESELQKFFPNDNKSDS